MPLKVKVAVCLAAFTGVLTVFLSFFNGIRLMTILYRGIFTIALFLALGYMLGILFEVCVKKLEENNANKGRNIDIKDEPGADILPAADDTLTDLVPDEPTSVPEFKPLTPDAMANFSTTEK